MIEIIEGLPDNVLGIVAKGRVTRRDWSSVLLPKLQRSLEWHHRLRLYYEIRTRYPGAAWEEMALGPGQAPFWERVAMVTDTAWVRHTVLALRLVIPSEIRVFTTSQIPEGLTWITEADSRRRRPASAAIIATGGDNRSFHPPAQYLHQVF